MKRQRMITASGNGRAAAQAIHTMSRVRARTTTTSTSRSRPSVMIIRKMLRHCETPYSEPVSVATST